MAPTVENSVQAVAEPTAPSNDQSKPAPVEVEAQPKAVEGEGHSKPAPETVEVEAVEVEAQPKVYSKESERLVKQSWEILKKDAQRNGVNFFRKVFEIAPAAKAQFSFLQDSTIPFEQNPKVKTHALSVFTMTGDAATQLGEKGAYQVLQSRIHRIAAKHNAKGVTDPQFEVIKQSILYAIQVGVPDLWSPELESAWGDAYYILAAAIKAEAHAQMAQVDQST